MITPDEHYKEVEQIINSQADELRGRVEHTLRTTPMSKNGNYWYVEFALFDFHYSDKAIEKVGKELRSAGWPAIWSNIWIRVYDPNCPGIIAEKKKQEDEKKKKEEPKFRSVFDIFRLRK